jgi:hypothetical protein
MVFDYSVQKTFNQSIDIVDMGNTALRCLNSNNDAYYMIIKTTFGKTSIFRFGPVCPDLDMLLDDFFVNYKKIPYKEASIYKEIDKFINDFKKEITEVEEVTEFEAWEDFPPLKQQFENA